MGGRLGGERRLTTRTRRLPAYVGAALLAVGLLIGLLGALVPAGVSEAAEPSAVVQKVTIPLRQAVRELPLAAERRTGYDRDHFRHWVDADGDRCDTREEVLIAEATRKVTPGSGCAVRTGRWVSYYDRVTVTAARSLDIDHLVPLAEAWDSGASRWSAATRTAYANDLGDRRSLVAVTASSNRSKSDRDPAEWLPRYDRCRYLAEWTAVKVRWRLAVDKPEKLALAKLAGSCADRVLTIWRASTP